MCISWPQVWAQLRWEAKGRPLFSSMGRASISARSRNTFPCGFPVTVATASPASLFCSTSAISSALRAQGGFRLEMFPVISVCFIQSTSYFSSRSRKTEAAMLTISEMDMIKLPIQFSWKRRIHSTHRAATPMLTRKVRAYTIPWPGAPHTGWSTAPADCTTQRPNRPLFATIRPA